MATIMTTSRTRYSGVDDGVGEGDGVHVKVGVAVGSGVGKRSPLEQEL